MAPFHLSLHRGAVLGIFLLLVFPETAETLCMRIESGIERVQARIGDIMRRFGAGHQGLNFAQSGRQTERAATAPPGTTAAKSRLPGSSASAPREAERSSRSNASFARGLNELIQRNARNHQVSPDLIRAVIQAESGGRINARSRAGALGPMQLMPGTARMLGVNPLEPSQNINGGVRYLLAMARKFGNLNETLAAYNAGPGAVERYGGVPPYRETRNYIRRIRRTLAEPRNLDTRG